MKKKNLKKNNRYNGYNVHGQRCEVKTVKMYKETALEQYLDIMRQLKIAQTEGRRLEYTIDWTAMTGDEVRDFENELHRLMMLRSMFA